MGTVVRMLENEYLITANFFGIDWEFKRIRNQTQYEYLRITNKTQFESAWDFPLNVKIFDGTSQISVKKVQFSEKRTSLQMLLPDTIKKELIIQLSDGSVAGDKKEIFPTNGNCDFSKKYKGMCDGVIFVGNRRFHVARQILAQQSEFFANEFFGEKTKRSEFIVKNGIPEDFEKLLHCVYEPDRELSMEIVKKVLPIAAKYKFTRIRERCEHLLHLCDTEILSHVEIAELLELAEEFKLSKLKEDCLKEYNSLDARNKWTFLEHLNIDRVSKETLLIIAFKNIPKIERVEPNY